jgi:inosine-uridine nucleoside N-ribohydrolase
MQEDADLTLAHDPLVVATFIDRAVVRLREYFVAAETQGALTAGETVGSEVPLRQSAPLKDSSTLSEAASAAFVPITNVAVEVDPARFFRMFIARLSGGLDCSSSDAQGAAR